MTRIVRALALGCLLVLAGLPPLPGADAPAAPAGGDGLGESSADGAFGSEPAAGGGRRRRQPEMAE